MLAGLKNARDKYGVSWCPGENFNLRAEKAVKERTK
jgi:hypothetical protein